MSNTEVFTLPWADETNPIEVPRGTQAIAIGFDLEGNRTGYVHLEHEEYLRNMGKSAVFKRPDDETEYSMTADYNVEPWYTTRQEGETR